MKLSPAMIKALLSEWNGGITFGRSEPNRLNTRDALMRRELIQYSHAVQNGYYVYEFYIVTDKGKDILRELVQHK